MATSNRRDVQLVVRAKDEAGKAFESAAAALEKLLGVNDAVGVSATKTGGRLQELATLALTLDKAYAKISSSADNAAAAFARQQASINESRSQLAALAGQAAGAAAAIAKLKSADAIVDAGRDQSGRIAQLKFLTDQYDRLQTQQEKLRASIVSQEAALDGQRNSLQQIGSTAIAAERAQEQLRLTIDRETKALQSQTAAAERNAAVLATINRATGVSRDTSELQALNQQIEAHNNLIAKLKAEQQAQTELNRAKERGEALSRVAMGPTPSGKSARDSASVFQEADAAAVKQFETTVRQAAAAESEMAAAAARLRAQLDPLAVIEARLNREIAEANTLHRLGKITVTEHAQALVLLKANADRAKASLAGTGAPGAKPTMFGLTPYAVQNLGYQINDVVTQLASGTSLSQTLAQQGGQLIQIFPRVGSSIVAAFTNPAILATVAAVGALVLGLAEAEKQAKLLREFEGALTATADASAYQAANLAKATKQLDMYGLSAEDAVKVVRTFMKEGLDESKLVQFGETAKNMADVLGIEVPAAAEKLAGAFRGGYDAIKKLDTELNFLTASQREQIRALYDQGKAQEGAAAAMAILSGRYQEAANKQRGEWADAVRELGNAWTEFKTLLADTGFVRGMTAALNNLAAAAATAFRSMRSGGDAAALLGEIESKLAEIKRLEALVARDPNARDTTGQRADRALVSQRQGLVHLQRQYNELVGEAGEQAQANNRILQENTERERKANEDLAARTREVTDASRERSDAERVAAAEAEARREAARDLAQDAFRFASEAQKQEYTNARIAEARAKTEREITSQREAQARAAKTDAERRQREYAADIANNGRENLVSTAQRFNGMNETANRGDLQSFFRDNGINVDPKMTAWCAAFVNAVLAANGLPGTGALNARSFLGYGQDASSNPQVGDIVILNRGSNPAEGHVGFFQGFDENGNVKVLGGNQGDGVNTQTFDRDRVLGIRRAPNAGQVATEQVREQERLLEQQERYNERLDNQIETRAQDTELLRQQVGLTGEALIEKEREQAISQALLKAKQDAKKAGVDTESAEFQARLVLLAQTTGAYYDLAHAKDVAAAQREAVEQPVTDLTAQRDALQKQIEVLRAANETDGIPALEASLASVNAQLVTATQATIAFWEAVLAGANGGPAAFNTTATAIQGMITTLKTGMAEVRLESQTLGHQFLMTGQQINQSFAQGAAQAFDRFAQSVAEGKDVMTSLKEAFLQFAADFLRQIAQMIIQQAIFNAIGGSTGTGGGGLGGGIAGLIGKMFHEGGVVGKGGAPRLVSPTWFENATRYHGGGIAGLRPGEVPAILEEGERIRTVEQEAALQRQLAAGGSGGGAAPQIKIVNAIDAGDMVQKGLASKVGEKAILNLIRENKGAVQQALG